MAKRKKKPTEEELTDDIMGTNPFMTDTLITVSKRRTPKDVENGAINYEDNLIEITPYTKVFEVAGGKEKMLALSPRGKEMYLYLIHYAPKAKDYMWINRVHFMKSNEIKSVHTFLNALKELNDASYVQSKFKMKDVIWLNPLYFFKGSRLNRFPDKLTIKPYKKPNNNDRKNDE